MHEQVLGPVDGAHPAHREELEDAVPLRDDAADQGSRARLRGHRGLRHASGDRLGHGASIARMRRLSEFPAWWAGRDADPGPERIQVRALLRT